MTLAELSIRRPVFAWMLMLGLIVFGGLAFTRLGVSQLPDVDFPVITINLKMEGAPPEVMELDVVDVIEDKVMSIEGVKSVSSSAKSSSATVKVEFDLSRNIDLALQDVQAKIAQAQKQLPSEMDPPSITKTNPDDLPILFFSVQAEGYTRQELMTYVRDTLKNKFATLPGVGEVRMGGYLEPNMRVWIRDKDLKRFQLAVNDVIDNVGREHVDPPTGQVNEGVFEYNMRFYGEATEPDQFGQLRLNTRGGGPNYNPIRLADVATLQEGTEDVRTVARAMGQSSLNVGIVKQRGSNAVAVARAVRAKLAEIQPDLPKGMSVGINFDSSKYVEEAVGELNFTLLLSALMTGLVCWMFLGSFSSTFNVLLAIPTSIIGAFSVLHFFGFTLNTFTLLALSMAIGIVVDDAIMVLENITRHREMGKSRGRAALDGAKEITFAAAAASVSVVAIFLPVAFMSGIIGKFFFQFGVTMTAAVLISLLEALTLSPMRAASLGAEHVAEQRATKLGRFFEAAMTAAATFYGRTLELALRRKWAVIGAATAVCVGSFFILKLIRQEFIPAEDQGRFAIVIQTPVGSSLSLTDERAKTVEEFVKNRPEVFRYFVTVGAGGGNQSGDINQARVVVTMKPRGQRGIDPELGRELTQQDMMALARKTLGKSKEFRLVVQDFNMRGLTSSRGFPVEFTVQGPNWEELAKHANAIREELSKTGLVTDIDTDYKVGMPEIQIFPDRIKASERGVPLRAVGETINAMIGGQRIGQYPKDGHRYDIRIKLQDDERDQVERIRGLYVRNNRGELVRLSDLVRIDKKPTVQAVARVNRERSITVYANLAKGQSQKRALDEIQSIAKRVLPDQYHVVFSGSSQTFQESFGSLIFALVFGIFVAYMVLATQFNSFIDPVTVLVALPFSITGAFFALYLGGQSINIYSMIGLILLMGIAKKNSILLVDFTNQVRERGEKSVVKALLQACPIRLRPILMTSFATIAGAIPPALAIGPGAESRIPMAVTVIGGVLVSTIFTLYLVPCVYLALSRFENKKSWLDGEAPGEENESANTQGNGSGHPGRKRSRVVATPTVTQ